MARARAYTVFRNDYSDTLLISLDAHGSTSQGRLGHLPGPPISTREYPTYT
jgi:hypothetical protein